MPKRPAKRWFEYSTRKAQLAAMERELLARPDPMAAVRREAGLDMSLSLDDDPESNPDD